MMAMNKVMLAGNLTRDVAMKELNGGMTVGTFGLAMNERYTTQDGQQHEDVCFVDVEVWGKQAEACNRCLSKGAPAFIEGRLRLERWEDKTSGKGRAKLLVRADRVQFLNGTTRPQAEASGPRPSSVVSPRPQPPPANRPGGSARRG
ncbi:MAG: hypothetical protein A3K19_21015 [Lentisphaerae bacterium RIFOXYB12_FULL_65_16]|nr:MAG: hypothetical protein A3K18_16510 [Lentisphaerae bacterium RIFOXYA12_64_32]OGV84814.1 MAG: hypothetical protein A3K19_21015 [Lentisphaerae bacterium RIFOXYB12_FULL_65_16]